MSNMAIVGAELDTVFGDAQTTQLATGSIAELLKNVGGVAAGVQKQKEDAAKAKQAQADAAAAQQAQVDLQLAQLAANAEANPNGPAHQALIVAQAKAVQAAAKAGTYLAPSGAGSGPSRGGGSFLNKMKQNPGLAVGISVGVVAVVGTVIYLATRKRR